MIECSFHVECSDYIERQGTSEFLQTTASVNQSREFSSLADNSDRTKDIIKSQVYIERLSMECRTPLSLIRIVCSCQKSKTTLSFVLSLPFK